MPLVPSRARDQVLELLKEDHKQVKRHFRDFEKMCLEDDAAACRQIVQRVCAELLVHAELEEALFYPAARAALKGREAAELVDEAEVEHASARRLIEELQDLRPNDPRFKATFVVLSEYVVHHLREEENDLFVELTRVKADWDGLLQDMRERQHRLKAEHGLADAAEAELGATLHPAVHAVSAAPARASKAR
jgi:hypothetical protein